MNRRSALSVAAGIVLAVMVAAAAIAMGATGPEPVASADRVEAASSRRPTVETVRRTVRVERPARGASAAPLPAIAGAPAPVGASSAAADDDAWDDDGWDDDGWDGDEDHGGEDHEDEDHDDDGADDHDDD